MSRLNFKTQETEINSASLSSITIPMISAGLGEDIKAVKLVFKSLASLQKKGLYTPNVLTTGEDDFIMFAKNSFSNTKTFKDSAEHRSALLGAEIVVIKCIDNAIDQLGARCKDPKTTTVDKRACKTVIEQLTQQRALLSYRFLEGATKYLEVRKANINNFRLLNNKDDDDNLKYFLGLSDLLKKMKEKATKSSKSVAPSIISTKICEGINKDWSKYKKLISEFEVKIASDQKGKYAYESISLSSDKDVRSKRRTMISGSGLTIPSYVDFLIPDKSKKPSYEEYQKSPSAKHYKKFTKEEYDWIINSRDFKAFVAYLETPVGLGKKDPSGSLYTTDNTWSATKSGRKYYYPKEVVLIPKSLDKELADECAKGKTIPDCVTLTTSKTKVNNFVKICIAGGLAILLAVSTAVGVKHCNNEKDPTPIVEPASKEPDETSKYTETSNHTGDVTEVPYIDNPAEESEEPDTTTSMDSKTEEPDQEKGAETDKIPTKNPIHGGNDKVVKDDTSSESTKTTSNPDDGNSFWDWQ